MGLYRATGVVLRTQKLGEADRIVTFLTRDRGRLRAVGKGVRKTSSRFGARLEPFMHVDLQVAEGRTLDIVTQVETVRAYGAHLGSDYPAYTSGTAMLEAADRLVGEEGDPSPAHYRLLVGALAALAGRRHAPGLVLDAFLLRSLSIAGYAPSFDGCARCGEPGPHRSFNPSAGGMLCTRCRLPGSANPTPDTVELMGALLSGDWGPADASTERTRREAAGLVAAYLSWHLERGLRSLPFVDRVPAEAWA